VGGTGPGGGRAGIRVGEGREISSRKRSAKKASTRPDQFIKAPHFIPICNEGDVSSLFP
jgi:hypothetical protein